MSFNEVPASVERKLASGARQSERAIVVGNRAGVHEWAHDAWTRITGRSRATTLSQPVGDFLVEAEIDIDLVDFVQASFLRGSPCEVELPFTTPEGQALWIHLKVDPIRDRFGEVSEFVAVAGGGGGRDTRRRYNYQLIW